VATGQPVDDARPQRTCVGCRTRVARAELLRLVVVDGSVTPDPAGRMPGRGAHLHPDPACLDLALRRRAFPRAFRLPGPLDTAPVQGYLEAARPTNDGD
jgi:uncharacterized protein